MFSVIQDKTKIIKISIFCIVVLFIMFLLSFIISHFLDRKEVYKINDIGVTSIAKVVGMRRVGHFDQCRENGKWIKNYKYTKVENPVMDVKKYVEYMIEKENFICDDKIDLNSKEGEVIIYKNYTKPETCIEISIEYSDDSYNICILEK